MANSSYGVVDGSLCKYSSAFKRALRSFWIFGILSLSMRVCQKYMLFSSVDIRDFHQNIWWFAMTLLRVYLNLSKLTWPWYLCTLRKSKRGCMLSASWKSFDDKCRLRNWTPFPIDDGMERRGKDALNGSKSSSRTKGSGLLLSCGIKHQP